jgi:hypothetical protein
MKTLQNKAETSGSVWECNDCGSQEYTSNVSFDDVHKLNCSQCGSSEWHQAQPDRIPDAGKMISEEPSLPEQATGWDNGLSQDYNKKLGAWFSEKPNAKQELRARTFNNHRKIEND